MQPPNEVPHAVQMGLVKVWCERCFYHWQGQGRKFGDALARAHVQRTGHMVELSVRYFGEKEEQAA